MGQRWIVHDLETLQKLKHIKHIELSEPRGREIHSTELLEAMWRAARPDRKHLSTATLFGRHFKRKLPENWILVGEGERHRHFAQVFRWADLL